MDPRLPILAGALAFLAFALLVLLITLVRARKASRLADADSHRYDSVRAGGHDRELFSPATGGMAAVLSQPLRTGAWHPDETALVLGEAPLSSGDYWDNLINEPALLVKDPADTLVKPIQPTGEPEEVWLQELVADLDATPVPVPPETTRSQPIVQPSPVYEFTPEPVVTATPVVPAPVTAPAPAPEPAAEPTPAPEPAAPAPVAAVAPIVPPAPVVVPAPAPEPEPAQVVEQTSPEPVVAPTPVVAPAQVVEQTSPEPVVAPAPVVAPTPRAPAPEPPAPVVAPAAVVVPSPPAPRPDRPKVSVPPQPVPPAQEERPRVAMPVREPEARPAVIVRTSDTPDAPPPVESTPKLEARPAVAALDETGPRSRIPEHVLVAPVEMWFEDHRVGVKAGTKTYDQFQRIAQVLFDDLKQARASQK